MSENRLWSRTRNGVRGMVETEAGLLPRSKDEGEQWGYREHLCECTCLVAKTSNSWKKRFLMHTFGTQNTSHLLWNWSQTWKWRERKQGTEPKRDLYLTCTWVSCGRVLTSVCAPPLARLHQYPNHNMGKKVHSRWTVRQKLQDTS